MGENSPGSVDASSWIPIEYDLDMAPGGDEAPVENRHLPVEGANAEVEIPIIVPELEDPPEAIQEAAAPEQAPVYNLRRRSGLREPDRFQACVTSCGEPESYDEAISCENSDLWKRAIREEFLAHERNGTWEVVELPEGRRPIGYKWVFKIKNPSEATERFKARLCAQGFSQQAGVDYHEIFSPVVRYESIRVLLAIAAADNLKSVQFDVSTAYLNSDLKEPIYMRVLDGLDIDPKFVLKLNKAIYGLKQSGRCWNEKVSNFFMKLGFTQSHADTCVFVGVFEGSRVYAALYVDDGFFLSRDERVLNKLVRIFENEFKIVSGKLSNFVGMEIAQENDSIFISQAKYIDKVLERFGMSECEAVKTPADCNVKLVRPVNGVSLDVPYREAVGSLLFLAMVTRPDIAYAVGIVSRYLDNHDMSHWRAVKRIMSYLKGTRDLGILFTSDRSDGKLMGFSDSDYAGDIDTRRSTSGYLFVMSGGCVTWSSRRQPVVAQNTTEAELIAACEACKEIVWLRKLLSDIGHECAEPVVLNVDNQSSIRLIRNPEFHRRSKHIDVRYHFIQEKMRDNVIEPIYVKSGEQCADIFTKALPYNTYNYLREKMSVICKNPKILK